MDFQYKYLTFDEWVEACDGRYVKYVYYLVHLFESACKMGDYEKVKEVYKDLKKRHNNSILTVDHILCCIDLVSCFQGALYTNSYELVKFFCENGIFSLIPYDKKEELLVNMCYESSSEIIGEVLNVWNVDINELHFENLTCLSNAAQNCDGDKTIKLLIEKGADPNLKDGNGDTSLMVASYLQYMENIETLLNNGADPSIANSEGHIYKYFI